MTSYATVIGKNCLPVDSAGATVCRREHNWMDGIEHLVVKLKTVDSRSQLQLSARVTDVSTQPLQQHRKG